MNEANKIQDRCYQIQFGCFWPQKVVNGASTTVAIFFGICSLHAVTVSACDTTSIMLRLAFHVVR
jgi:hypothetical protein